MDVNDILFKILCLCLLASSYDAQVNVPLRAIKDGIGRPLTTTRDKVFDAIYLASASFRRRPHHYPPRQLQDKQQHNGFLRNANHHPHRPAPVANHNHLGELGNQGRVHPTNKPRYNHHIQYPHHQQLMTTEQKIRPNHLPSIDPYRTDLRKNPTTIPAIHLKPEFSTRAPQSVEESVSHNTPLVDPHNVLQLQATGDEYLTFLYLTPDGTRLEQEYMQAAAAYVPDKDSQQSSIDQEKIIKPPEQNYDPYVLRSMPKKPATHLQVKQTRADDGNAIDSLEHDWLPIHSPWDKYRKKHSKDECDSKPC